MQINLIKKDNKNLIKLLTFWIPLKKWRKKAREILQKFFLSFIPINDSWVIFYDTFSKNGNGDSIRAIAEELRKRKPDFKFFFVSKEMRPIDMADEVLVLGSQRYEYVLARAKYLVSPMDLPSSKRKEQIWIMTWHGTPLKKLYLSRANKPEYRKYVENFKNVDIFCNSSPDCLKIYQEAFNIKENIIIPTGLPRNDILFCKNKDFIKDSVKEELCLPKDKKILFYCPTWRRYDWKMPMPMDLSKMKKSLSEEYCIMLRSHVGKHEWINGQGEKVSIGNDGFSFDVGEYPDISKLYLVADILISDYSSSIFDFAITQKPQIFYAYDLEEYNQEFQFYYNYETFVPGKIAKTTDELITAVQDIKNYEKTYGNKYKQFYQDYCTFEDGHAAERIVDFILKNQDTNITQGKNK